MVCCSCCGVELDVNMKICPLCNAAVSDHIPDVREQIRESVAPDKRTYKSEILELTPAQRRKLAWELSVIILLAGAVVTLLIDSLTSKSIIWSKFAASTCLALIIQITLIYFWWKRLYLFLLASFLSLSILLVLYDSYAFHIGWGKQVGIPLLLLIFISILIFILLIRHINEQGLNLIAYFMTASGILCFGIENILDLYLLGSIHADWSLFVIISVLPIAGILLFIHYRFQKGRELRRLFHI